MEGKRRSDETPVPMARVVDEDGREVCRGWYARLRRSTYCFKDDEPEDNVMECVIVDETTDWGMPNRHIVKEVAPPHRIEAVDDACTLVEDRPYECRCDVCGAKSMYPTTAWRFCPCCGRRIAGYRWYGERDEEARDA